MSCDGGGAGGDGRGGGVEEGIDIASDSEGIGKSDCDDSYIPL